MRGGDRTSLGLWGEKQAARYLKKQGFRLLETRFRCREGEIDLVLSREENRAMLADKFELLLREYIASAKKELPRGRMRIKRRRGQ